MNLPIKSNSETFNRDKSLDNSLLLQQLINEKTQPNNLTINFIADPQR
nr:MAG TPA: hypothetical protein [Caudoviricetes sp.]